MIVILALAYPAHLNLNLINASRAIFPLDLLRTDLRETFPTAKNAIR